MNPRALIRILAFATAACLAFASPALAHVGSPDVFYEGDAGAYHLFVTVNVPQVIPGVAEVQVRSADGNVSGVSTSVTRLTGGGSRYAPVPDVAVRSTVDPHLFTSSIWLMEYGSLRLLLKVRGDKGNAEMSVPVASFARRNLAMPRWLGALLLALTTALALGAISIVGAAARESMIDPGAQPDARARRRGLTAMGTTAAIAAAIFYLAFTWWNADARAYTRITRLFKPPPLSATLESDHLKVQAAESEWSRHRVMDKLLADHGYLMHLFLLRTPGFDRFWHLHPQHAPDGSFDAALPPLDSGRYKLFADVVDESGFPWTLVGEIDLPDVRGGAIGSDDSGGSFPPINASSDRCVDVLSDGTRVVWKHDQLRANTPMPLRFSVEDRGGAPASDLEPYLGMAAHLEVVKSDLSVFAHIHPSGSAPMAALMLINRQDDSGAKARSMADMPMHPMPGMNRLSPELSMPYGFPSPGEYRLFLQFRRAGRIETAAFDAQVR